MYNRNNISGSSRCNSIQSFPSYGSIPEIESTTTLTLTTTTTTTVASTGAGAAVVGTVEMSTASTTATTTNDVEQQVVDAVTITPQALDGNSNNAANSNHNNNNNNNNTLSSSSSSSLLHHRRGSTNTDIASIFHIPSYLLRSTIGVNGNGGNQTTTTTTTAVLEDDESTTPLLLRQHHQRDNENDNDDDDSVHTVLGVMGTRHHRGRVNGNNSCCCTICCCCWNSTSNNILSFLSNIGCGYCFGDALPSNIIQSTTTNKSMYIDIGATLNLCSATLGAGVLALPYALLQSGLIIGFILLLFAAIATERSIFVLITVLDIVPSTCTKSYESITEYILQSKMYRTSIEISMLFFCCGCAIGYIMAIGDILEQFHLLFIYNNRNYTLIFVWLIAMVPLSLCKNVQSLQYASAVGISAIVILVIASLVHLIQNHYHSNPHHYYYEHETDYLVYPYTDANAHGNIIQLLLRWRNGWSGDTTTTISSSDNNVHLRDFLWPSNGLISVLTAGPVVLFAFSCQPNVCSIYDELKPIQHHTSSSVTTTSQNNNDKVRLMHQVTIVAVCICAMLYCSISVIALADFGTQVQPNMLSCYMDHNNLLIQFATGAMALAIVMAFPLNIFPARITLIGLWDNYNTTYSERENNTERSISLHQLPNGGLTSALLQDDNNLNCVSSNSHNVVQEDCYDTRTNIHHYNMNENNTDALIPNNRAEDIEPPFNRTIHIVSTLFLTILTLVLALILPNISVVFGLLGGTASSWLGFCVPGLLGLHMSKHEVFIDENQRYKMMVTSWSLFIGGITIGIFTTGVTVYNTLMYKK